MTKVIKKLLAVSFAATFVFILVACGGTTPEQRLQQAYDNLELVFVGSDTADGASSAVVLTSNGLHGTEVSWTSSNNALLSATTGKVARRSPNAEPETVTLTATIKIAKDDVITLERTKTFEVVVTGTSLYSYDEVFEALVNGEYATASPEVRLAILAAMEKYLIDHQTSIPLFSNSTATLLSDRVQLPNGGKWVPVMGQNILGSTLDPVGTVGNTFRLATSAFPATLNHLHYADSAESDTLTLILGSLFEFDYGDDLDEDGDSTGYQLVNSMAESVEAIDADEDGASTTWKITLRDDLFWQEGEYAGDVTIVPDTQITAADFLYTYQQLLDPNWVFRRANVLYSSTFPVVGAAAYFNAEEDAEWADVGLKPVDGDPLSFTVELTRSFKEYDFKYQMSSFVLSPVYEPLFEALATKPTSGAWTTTYGSSPTHVVGHGLYRLTEWVHNQTLTYERWDTYFDQEAYSFDAITRTYVVDANAALQLFNSGSIDTTGVPASEFDDYVNQAIRIPGATVFRLNINTATQKELDYLTGGQWTAKPILQELAFREALYYAINREELAYDVGKVWTPAQAYFSGAYAYDAEQGLIYRDTPEAQAVIAQRSPATSGYNSEIAKEKYEEALASLIEAGTINSNATIRIEFALFDGATWESVGAWLKDELEDIFVSTAYPNVTFIADVSYYGGLDVYYEKQMPGNYDVAVGGISGGTLDPYGFLDVFMSNNVSGLFLNHGFHTSARDIDLDALLEGLLDD